MNAWDPTETQPVQPVQPVLPVRSETGPEAARNWLERFITTVNESDLDVLALWAVHTHLAFETYSSPRLLIDSPVPGSGKTTVLEHLSRLCHHPVQAASLSSPALLARLVDAGMRTILIDEADRSLSPKLDGVGELLAILNSGYKRGGTRPTLVPIKGGGWDAKEMTTFSPVAMAGNSPDLPDDTRSRCIRVLLMPDIDGTSDESDWEYIEDDAKHVGARIASWADAVRDDVRGTKADLPPVVRGRMKECWGPLKRIALAAGGRWPDVVDDLAQQDVERVAREKDEGIVIEKPHMSLISHMHDAWPDGATFVPTDEMIATLVHDHPETWGQFSPFGRELTPQRMGRMLVKHFKVTTSRPDGRRGYTRASLEPAFRSLGLDTRNEPAKPVEPVEPARRGYFPAELVAAAKPICGYCGEAMTFDDGSGVHPTCGVAS